MSERVVVVGAGVAGLSCAIRLQEDAARRFDVRIVAARVASASMSCVAAASFYPYAVAHEHVATWLRTSLSAFVRLAEVTGSGVLLRQAREACAAAGDAASDASFADKVLEHRAGIGQAAGMDARFVHGHRFVAPVIEMPLYLEYLRRRFERAGGTIERATLASLQEVAEAGVVVVHCAGLHARELASDPAVHARLGQVVRIQGIAGVDEFRIWKGLAHEGLPAYVVPRATDCVLGSIDCAWSVERLGFEPPAPDAQVTRDIVLRCAQLDARVLDAQVLDAACGLRPARATVRVEVDRDALRRGARIVHNYGHGGAGVTLSWGCAEQVARLVESLLR